MTQKKQKPLKQEDFATKITRWVGSPASLTLHTIFFIVMFLLPLFGVSISSTLLILTTIVSLEAIYLSLLIQLTVNRNTQSLEVVEENLDEIQIDVDEIQKDVDEIQKDVDEIQIDVDEIEKDVDEIEKDVDELHAADIEDDKYEITTKDTLSAIEGKLQSLIADIEYLKKKNER